MQPFISNSNDPDSKYEAAARFVTWLEQQVVSEARGDGLEASPVDPTGRFWLGRLGPKDFVTLPDSRGDRLEPCAIGARIRPIGGPWKFQATVRCTVWSRDKAEEGGQRWRWKKLRPLDLSLSAEVPEEPGEYIFGEEQLAAAFVSIGAPGLSAQIRAFVTGRRSRQRALEITLVNSTTSELAEFAESRFFESELTISGLSTIPFELEALPDSFRFERNVAAFGINCGVVNDSGSLRTTDAPVFSRCRPKYWSVEDEQPDFRFSTLATEPIATAERLCASFEKWAGENWAESELNNRAIQEAWSPGMRAEAAEARDAFLLEVKRMRDGLDRLKGNDQLQTAFAAMNSAMELSARGRYDSWRPFQLGFLLANLSSLVDQDDSDIVDVVWFATGGGKTETYLGLLITAALLDRMTGKLSGITAWSRFPLRLLSLQQTQRFANALAAAEVVRKRLKLAGDPFSLGFLVGSGATPNRIKKESERDNEDADKISDMKNPFLLLDECPFCRQKGVTTKFDRRSWRLLHLCSNTECSNAGEPLPLYVVDDEIWRFLPTIVVGTLDKAANISRQAGMRSLVGSPWGLCSKPGHGYTYARRRDFPHGCLVPDCNGSAGALPIAASLYAPTFRLQDELHLLRDSLGAVDAHYEAALDSIQLEITGKQAKILASSATLTGYEKQIDVLYQRRARVFPQPPPKEGVGFWTADSLQMMRRYVALAPRRLTVEFVVDRLVVSLQKAVRTLLSDPASLCRLLEIDVGFAGFLVDLYGTNVVYGNTLQDIDAVIRSAETQYADISPPPNIGTLTGRTAFEEVRETLERLQNPEAQFEDRLHLIAASSMMSHGVDIDRLNVMVMMALPLGVAEFIQATARVGRRWPALVIVIPKMTRERDASVYRAFGEFVSHGDRFVEPIPITRKSRRVLERTIAGMQLARIVQIHEPAANMRLSTPRDLNTFVRENPEVLADDREAIADSLGLVEEDEFMRDQLERWFEGFARNLRQPPADTRFISDLSPSGDPMLSLRDVEEQAPVSGDSGQ